MVLDQFCVDFLVHIHNSKSIDIFILAPLYPKPKPYLVLHVFERRLSLLLQKCPQIELLYFELRNHFQIAHQPHIKLDLFVDAIKVRHLAILHVAAEQVTFDCDSIFFKFEGLAARKLRISEHQRWRNTLICKVQAVLRENLPLLQSLCVGVRPFQFLVD